MNEFENRKIKTKSIDKFVNYSKTPNIHNKAIEEIELRKTKYKPQIISSVLPSVFEIPKFEKRYILILIQKKLPR